MAEFKQYFDNMYFSRNSARLLGEVKARDEGEEDIVQDGDVIHFRFNT